MADALASGASVRKDMGVQVPPSAPRKVLISKEVQYFFFFVLTCTMQNKHNRSNQTDSTKYIDKTVSFCYNIIRR